MRNDSITKTVVVIILLCGVCSILVSTAAVQLRPVQEDNAILSLNRGILEVAGLYKGGTDISQLMQMVDTRIVDLSTGNFSSEVVADSFDMIDSANDISKSRALSAAEDMASIGRLPRYAKVHLIRKQQQLKYIILPIYGYGLWSTLYGFIALEGDGNTVYGLRFYQHKETPGLGGRVDSPDWLKQWKGKQIYDQDRGVALAVGKCRPLGTKEPVHLLDGLSGATITSCGVNNMVEFWFSDLGYGRFLAARPFDVRS